MMRRRIRRAKGILYLIVCAVLTMYGIVVVFLGLHHLFLEEGFTLFFHSFAFIGIWLWLRWGKKESPLRFLKREVEEGRDADTVLRGY